MITLYVFFANALINLGMSILKHSKDWHVSVYLKDEMAKSLYVLVPFIIFGLKFFDHESYASIQQYEFIINIVFSSAFMVSIIHSLGLLNYFNQFNGIMKELHGEKKDDK